MSESALTSPEKKLHVIYVIPLRGEVANGIFFNQLQDLTNQRELHKDEFEVLYVLHNAIDNKDLHTLIAPENALIHQIVLFIQGNLDAHPSELADWQVELVLKAKENRLRVQVVTINESKDTKELLSPRAYGERIARERLQSLGTAGLIVHVDSDTGMGVRSTFAVAEQMRTNPMTGMLAIQFDMESELHEENIYALLHDPKEQFTRQVKLLSRTIQGKSQIGWYSLKTASLDQPKQKWEIHAGTGINFYLHDRPRKQRDESVVGNTDNKVAKLTTHPALTLLVFIYENNKENKQIRENTRAIFTFYFSNKPWFADIDTKIEKQEFIQYHIQWLDEYTQALPIREYADTVYGMMEILCSSTRDILDLCIEKEKAKGGDLNDDYVYANAVLGGITTFLQIHPISYPQREYY